MRTILLARLLLATTAIVVVLHMAGVVLDSPRARAEGAPSLQVSPATAAPGETVTLHGSRWPAGTSLVARLYEASAMGGPSADMGMIFQSDSSGEFVIQATVPTTLFNPAGSRGSLLVVPGSYVIVASSGPELTASTPFTVGAPSQGGLLWGQVTFDTNGNGRYDSTDAPAGEFVLVTVKGSSQDGTALRAKTDGLGRYMLTPISADQYTLGAQGGYQSATWTGATTASVQTGRSTKADLLLHPTITGVSPERYFKETGFYVDNDAFWDYFTHRGGVRTLGYPISRTFQFQGYPTQFFQRVVLQEVPGQGVQRLNLLDPDMLPYSHINGSQLPPVDPEIKAAAPGAEQSDYDTKIIDFVRHWVPNEVDGKRVGFFDAFMGTVTGQDAFPNEGGHEELLPLLNLEIWGVPISKPTPDPSNDSFVYLRFQRGIMHFQGYDGNGNPITEGILLGDWFKSLITGSNLPPDLEAEAWAGNSPFLRQYNPDRPNWVANPARLPDTNLSFAFEPE